MKIQIEPYVAYVVTLSNDQAAIVNDGKLEIA